ncbi:MAG: prepilin-type N-terminal cleavage/methylation domain-containing protein [Chloroflexota bacterium]|nr:prepilin-type N-terminal cleavage/methylation domain-containing protein [Chloroflexota bacterium]
MKRQKGQSLIEVLIALAILGIVAVAFLTALSTASKSIIVSDEMTTAESLARSELEYVKSQDYIDYSKDFSEREPDVYGRIAIPPELVGYYTLEATAEPINPSDQTDPETNPVTPSHQPYPAAAGVYQKDAGLQQITVKVYHQGKLVLTTSDYKVNYEVD